MEDVVAVVLRLYPTIEDRLAELFEMAAIGAEQRRQQLLPHAEPILVAAIDQFTAENSPQPKVRLVQQREIAMAASAAC